MKSTKQHFFPKHIGHIFIQSLISFLIGILICAILFGIFCFFKNIFLFLKENWRKAKYYINSPEQAKGRGLR